MSWTGYAELLEAAQRNSELIAKIKTVRSDWEAADLLQHFKLDAVVRCSDCLKRQALVDGLGKAES
jgi:hypothetical protein